MSYSTSKPKLLSSYSSSVGGKDNNINRVVTNSSELSYHSADFSPTDSCSSSSSSSSASASASSLYSSDSSSPSSYDSFISSRPSSANSVTNTSTFSSSPPYPLSERNYFSSTTPSISRASTISIQSTLKSNHYHGGRNNNYVNNVSDNDSVSVFEGRSPSPISSLSNGSIDSYASTGLSDSINSTTPPPLFQLSGPSGRSFSASSPNSLGLHRNQPNHNHLHHSPNHSSSPTPNSPYSPGTPTNNLSLSLTPVTSKPSTNINSALSNLSSLTSSSSSSSSSSSVISYPLSTVQRSIWLSEQKTPQHPQYNLTLDYKWTEEIKSFNRREIVNSVQSSSTYSSDSLQPSFCWACFRYAVVSLIAESDSLRSTISSSGDCCYIHSLTIPDILTFHTSDEAFPNSNQHAPTLNQKGKAQIFCRYTNINQEKNELNMSNNNFNNNKINIIDNDKKIGHSRKDMDSGFDLEVCLPIKVIFNSHGKSKNTVLESSSSSLLLSPSSILSTSSTNFTHIDHHLCVIVHHVAADGYSMTQLIHKKIWDLYQKSNNSIHESNKMNINKSVLSTNISDVTPPLIYGIDFACYGGTLRDCVTSQLKSPELNLEIKPSIDSNSINHFIESLNIQANYYNNPKFNSCSEIKFPPIISKEADINKILTNRPEMQLSPLVNQNANHINNTRLPVKSRQNFSVDGNSIKQISSHYGTSEFTVLTSLIWLLFARYTGSNCFGLNIALLGRPRTSNQQINKKWLNIIGEFAYSSTIIANVESFHTTTMKELVEIFHSAIKLTKDHEQVTINDLHLLASQPNKVNIPNRSRVTLSAIPSIEKTASFLSSLPTNTTSSYIGYGDSDINLYWCKDKNELIWSYNINAISPSIVEQMQQNLDTIIHSAGINSINLPLINYQWVHPNQLYHIDVNFHRKTQESPFQQTLHGLFDLTVNRLGDESKERIAIIDKERQLSYFELNQRSLSLALLMQHSNISIRPNNNQTIAILVDRSLTCLISLLAVMRAGATYLPLDSRLPMERLYYMMKDVKADLLLCCPSKSCQTLCNELGYAMKERKELNWHAWRLDHQGKVESIESFLINQQNSTSTTVPSTDHLSLLPMSVSPLTVAFLIYTSGTTGNPKAVRVRHGGSSNTIHAMQEFFNFGPADRHLQSASLCFDAHIAQCFGPWSQGSTVVLLDEDIGIAQTVEKYQVSMIEFVPSVLGSLRFDSEEFSSLRLVQAIGEACPLKVATTWSSKYSTMTNGYGPTEISIYSHIALIKPDDARVMIGKPLPNTYSYILDESLQPVPIGVAGLLYIGGYGVADGYHGLPDLTAERFIPDPFHPKDGYGVMYNSGDLCRWSIDGQLECLGRIDHQVKWHGMRIELQEIEECILSADQKQIQEGNPQKFKINQAAVILYKPINQIINNNNNDVQATVEPFLAAYVSPTQVDINLLKKYLSSRLPYWMIPTSFTLLASLALSSNGKLDRKQLPLPNFPHLGMDKTNQTKKSEQFKNDIPSSSALSPSSSAGAKDIESRLSRIWHEVLGYSISDIDLSFFDAGGHSLSLMKLADKIRTEFDYSDNASVPKVGDLFIHTSIRSQSLLIWPLIPKKDKEIFRLSSTLPTRRHMRSRGGTPSISPKMATMPSPLRATPGLMNSIAPIISNNLYLNDEMGDSIAVIGMDGVFPSASNMEEFWSLLLNCGDGVRSLSEEELLAAGISPLIYQHKRYVNATGWLGQTEMFDNEFFGLSSREASEMDPQHRLLLERCHNALEDASVDMNKEGGSMGIFVASAESKYLHHNLGHYYNNPDTSKAEKYRMRLGNMMGSAATRIAYTLNLHGPAISVNTACSSGLVAVATAIDQLKLSRCKLALACATSIDAPQVGYVYEDGMIYSAHGTCRPFDSSADGITLGNAVCAMVLQPLRDALKEGRSIYGVIRSVAMNNNGHRGDQLHFAAPSIEGQVECIHTALTLANVSPDTIGYVEGHGTGTRLGDVAEVKALTAVFSESRRIQPIILSSVKGNVGHCDTASGMVGLMKALLTVKNSYLPATAHFKEGNINIDWENIPFQVRNTGAEWNNCSNQNFSVVNHMGSTVNLTLPNRVALVTSLGMGGTNAVAIVQSAPQQQELIDVKEAIKLSNTHQLIILSAKTPNVLNSVKERLNNFILSKQKLMTKTFSSPSSFSSVNDELFNLSNLSYSLSVGRTPYPYRCAFTVDSFESLSSYLNVDILPSRNSVDRVLFMFPGQGSIDRLITRSIYNNSPLFRSSWQHCDNIVAQHSSGLPCVSLTTILIASPLSYIEEWEIYLPILTFMLEYCMSRIWLSVIEPPYLFLGHSVGEYVAAVCTGIMSMEESLALLCARTRIMTKKFFSSNLSSAHQGSKMIAVRCNADKAANIVNLAKDNNFTLSITGINSSNQSVLAGDITAVEWLTKYLSQHKIQHKILPLPIPYHSHLIDADLVNMFKSTPEYMSLTEYSRECGRYPVDSNFALISSVTGRLVNEDDPITIAHWSNHMIQPVLFNQAVITAMTNELTNVQDNTIPASPNGTIIRKRSLSTFSNPNKESNANSLSNSVGPTISSYCLCIELGCGSSLTNLVKHSSSAAQLIPLTVSAMPNLINQSNDSLSLLDLDQQVRKLILSSFGEVWSCSTNIDIDWKSAWQTINNDTNQVPKLLHLPTYPYQKKKFWINPKIQHQQQQINNSNILDSILDVLNNPPINIPVTSDNSIQLSSPVHDSSSDDVLSDVSSILCDVIHLSSGSVNADLDFFSLGGDSFTSIIMLHRINSKFNVELPMYSLLNNTTIKQLATQIKEIREKERLKENFLNHSVAGDFEGAATTSIKYLSSPNLVILQSGDPTSTPPLIVIAPTGGTLFIYRDLVSSLSSSLPVYGIKYPQGNDEAESSVEKLTDYYVRILLSLDLTDPYQLCGTSFGGMLVYEMAQQINQLKQEREYNYSNNIKTLNHLYRENSMLDVSLIVMLDSPTLLSLRIDASAPSILALMFDEKFEISAAEVAALVKMKSEEMLKFVLIKGILPSQPLINNNKNNSPISSLSTLSCCDGRIYDPVEWNQLQSYMHIFESNLEIMCKYKPKTFFQSCDNKYSNSSSPSRSTCLIPTILFFEPSEPREYDPISSSVDWIPSIKSSPSGVQFILEKSKGNHLTMMFQPNIKQNAKSIQNHLRTGRT